MTTADRRLFVATSEGLFRLEHDGEWQVRQVSFPGAPVSMVLPDRRDGTLYAALDLGPSGVKLHRSADGGNAWEEIGAPAYPPQPEAAAHDQHPWSVKLVWSLEAGGPDQPGLLWAGTVPGGLFLSRDRGTTWQLVASLWNRPERQEWFGGGHDLPGIHSILVDPRSSNHLLVAVSCGGVWRTEDLGATWELSAKGMWAAYMPPERREDQRIQDAHRVVRAPADPDILYAQHHNSAFVSRDGGRRWQDLTAIRPSAFGLTVAVHPHEPDTAWFVPAVKGECRVPVGGKLVVARTRNGGDHFEVISRGLPEEDAQRHRLSPRPRRGRLRQPARHGLHHRLALDQRRLRLELASDCGAPAADPLRAVRVGRPLSRAATARRRAAGAL